MASTLGKALGATGWGLAIGLAGFMALKPSPVQPAVFGCTATPLPARISVDDAATKAADLGLATYWRQWVMGDIDKSVPIDRRSRMLFCAFEASRNRPEQTQQRPPHKPWPWLPRYATDEPPRVNMGLPASLSLPGLKVR